MTVYDASAFHDGVAALITDCERLCPSAQRVPLIRPFSANAMFVQVAGKRVKTRQYKAWRTEQAYALIAKGGRRRLFKSAALILCPQQYGGDTDNVNKAYIDAFVEVGILADDNAITGCVTYPQSEVDGYALIIPEGGYGIG